MRTQLKRLAMGMLVAMMLMGCDRKTEARTESKDTPRVDTQSQLVEIERERLKVEKQAAFDRAKADIERDYQTARAHNREEYDKATKDLQKMIENGVLSGERATKVSDQNGEHFDLMQKMASETAAAKLRVLKQRQ